MHEKQGESWTGSGAVEIVKMRGVGGGSEAVILSSLMDVVAKLLWMCCRGEGSPSWRRFAVVGWTQKIMENNAKCCPVPYGPGELA